MTYNKNRIYKEAFIACKKHFNCSQNWDGDEAKIFNDIHNEIWTNITTTDDEKWKASRSLEAAFKENSDELYEYYHNYFTQKINVTQPPTSPISYL